MAKNRRGRKREKNKLFEKEGEQFDTTIYRAENKRNWIMEKKVYKNGVRIVSAKGIKSKRKHTVGLEPTISCSVGKRLIQLGYACSE